MGNGNNWWEKRHFSFARLPKAFWENERYRHLNIDVIILYSLMLDRTSLSEANGWRDEKGEVFVYFTLDEIQSKMRCSRGKANKLKQILLKENLIRFEQQGKADPHRIYVLPFFNSPETGPVKSKNETLCSSGNELHEVYFSDPNNTSKNNTIFINTDLSISGCDGYDSSIVREIIRENLEDDTLSKKEYDLALVNNIIDIMVDAVCSSGEMVRIGKEYVSRNMVRSQFFHFTKKDLDYVLYCLKQNSTEVKNIKAYLLTVLYNVRSTRETYWSMKVQHDYPQYVPKYLRGGEGNE